MSPSHYPQVELHYQPHVAAIRERILGDEKIARLLAEPVSEAQMLGFLLHFSALGVQMVEPVESWIRRAGAACIDRGFDELGAGLLEAAEGEAGHDAMMHADLRVLVSRWRESYLPPVDAASLLATPRTEAIRRYAEVHEETIAGEHPYAQIGIEFEIESMSLVLGPPLIAACKRAVDADIISAMSFVREHVELDLEHTSEDIAKLEAFLVANPGTGPTIAATGARALAAYLDFFTDCIDRGFALAASAKAIRRAG